ncbi:unnamed protein product [Parnassius apollo]|uniref:(apollo) hypothetical protein n=1 Tax=Parnassius apollo TaxID=110799 RepID=A0A8S3Y6P9_PARAO|nr:unnamed protein product [Parnassius apollo]
MISLLASHRREKGKVKKSHSSGKGGDETYKSTWFAYKALAFLEDRNNQGTTQHRGQNQTSYPTAPCASPVPSESSQISYEDVDFVN